MYTLDQTHGNRNIVPNAIYTIRCGTMNAMAQEVGHCTFRFGSIATSNMNVTGQQVSPCSMLHQTFASYDSSTQQKHSCAPFEPSVSMSVGSILSGSSISLENSKPLESSISLGSSISRIHGDVMSIDTFPCVPIGLVTHDQVIHWVDVPLVLVCNHNHNTIDDEEISMTDFDGTITTNDDESMHSGPLIISPIVSRSTRDGQWHFDIDGVESDLVSINTVETWSLSEDFS